MRQRQVWLFLKNSWGKLKTPPDCSENFKQPICTIMLAYLFVLQVMVVSKATDLKTVSGGNKYGVPSFLQLFLDWHKERNMRRVVEIYPDLFAFPQMIQFSLVFHCLGLANAVIAETCEYIPNLHITRPTLRLSLTSVFRAGCPSPSGIPPPSLSHAQRGATVSGAVGR